MLFIIDNSYYFIIAINLYVFFLIVVITMIYNIVYLMQVHCCLRLSELLHASAERTTTIIWEWNMELQLSIQFWTTSIFSIKFFNTFFFTCYCSIVSMSKLYAYILFTFELVKLLCGMYKHVIIKHVGTHNMELKKRSDLQSDFGQI